ncbi:MAG: hypothetical protein QOD99_395 [Chthoniobacter sp.]|jgi:tetratricopeptide (TPR) repeat protein|nr:hypothetical protein [Chthoniobacter sp.]
MLLRGCAVLLCALALIGHAESVKDELTAVQLLESAAIARYQSSARAPSDRAELEKVGEVFERLVKKYPRDAGVREAYGAYFWDIERRDAAFAQWQAGEGIDPKNAGIIFHLGHAWLDLGDAKKACDYFERAVRFAPREAIYHYNLGNALFLFRHEVADTTADAVAQRALSEMRTANELEPLNAELAKAYAMAFYTVAKPDWNDALKAWKRYLEISGDTDFACTNLARISLKVGDKTSARSFLARVSDPAFHRVKERLSAQADSKNPETVAP